MSNSINHRLQVAVLEVSVREALTCQNFYISQRFCVRAQVETVMFYYLFIKYPVKEAQEQPLTRSRTVRIESQRTSDIEIFDFITIDHHYIDIFLLYRQTLFSSSFQLLTLLLTTKNFF